VAPCAPSPYPDGRGAGRRARARGRPHRRLLRLFTLCYVPFRLLRLFTLCYAPFSRTVEGEGA